MVQGLLRRRRVATALARGAVGTIAAAFTPAAFARRARFAGQALVQGHRIVLQHLAFEDPGLHADDAVAGLGLGETVVDVGAQGVTGHAAFMIGFGPGDFRAAEAAGDLDPNALGAQTHGRLHGPLHSPAESDPPLKLLGDVFRHQLSVGFGFANLDDVEVHLALGHSREILAQLLDIRPLLADDHAGAGGVDGDPAALVWPLDPPPP